MLVKINKSDDLDKYIIRVKINDYILETNEVSHYITMDGKIKIESFLSFDCIETKKDNLLQKVGEYIFGVLFIYFISVDILLDSREYKNTICVESFSENGVLEINYFWNVQEEKVDVEIKITEGNVTSNEILETINQTVYDQNIKTYKKVIKCNWLILFTISLIVLIIACICKHKKMIMAQIVILIVLLLIYFIPYLIMKECLNYENFEKFHCNNKIYCLPDNFNEIYSKFNFYGNKHQVGYTIGVYNNICKTFILNSDEEENVLFQEDGRYFWFKEGFVFPNIEESNVTKLLIEKLDSKGYIIKEKEYALENISLNEFFIEYAIDQNTDSFLNDENNFLTFRIKYIYEDYIVTKYYDRITIYNDKVYIEKYNESNERRIYIVNDKFALSLYDCILSMD